MAKKKKNKREKVPVSPALVTAVVAFMAAIFVIQSLFPENFGAFLRKEAGEAVSISVTVTGGSETENATYTTDDPAQIQALLTWADGCRMRHRTLADTMNFTGQTRMKYSVAIQRADGSFGGVVIEEEAYIHFGAGVYQATGDRAAFLADFHSRLVSWEQ